MPIWLYIPFEMFVVVGVVNAVNLTDGLDGLASSITTIVGIFFMLVSYIVFKEYGVTVFSVALIGGLIGFLWYNKYPAKVFMGDTGSLFLGASVAPVSYTHLDVYKRQVSVLKKIGGNIVQFFSIK